MFKTNHSGKFSGERVFAALMLALLMLASGFGLPAALAGSPHIGTTAVPMASSGLKLYGVETIRGKRKTPSGEERSYTLYVPKATDGLPKPPYPMVVLIHGFLMTGAQQATNAENLSERGFIVFTPNITKVLLGDRTRMDNVHDIIDHIKWLTGKDSPVAGIVDSNRVAIGGNSSGGAVILEIALEAQKMHVPIAAMCSLDGVIWDRSMDRVKLLQPLKVLSLRCEPSICNEHARLLSHLQELKFPIDDVKVVGSHHCDVENPTTLRCSCVCGVTNNRFRRLFAQLLYAWLRDTFEAPKFSDNAPTFAAMVEGLQQGNKVIARLNQPVSLWLSHADQMKSDIR